MHKLQKAPLQTLQMRTQDAHVRRVQSPHEIAPRSFLLPQMKHALSHVGRGTGVDGATLAPPPRPVAVQNLSRDVCLCPSECRVELADMPLVEPGSAVE